MDDVLKTDSRSDDPYNLQRFIDGQAQVYDGVLSELQAGHKQTHWMWFIFPQLDGLGSRPWTVFYSIKNIEEARAYLEHPLLGKRLIQCTEAVMEHHNKSLLEIFGKPDNRKFCSCMTLFAAISDKPAFRQAIDRFCNGQADENSLALIRKLTPA
ncbi:DUF1810 domain-containing protein [Thiomicrorhabdus xiamenensis]|uniref:DUF1810 domain-containing protein n=1 Tax=Thiomicrorhabdus xiamenensis TaxID=2739063 RepID=A0A7D4TFU4_9GAMM|nr:DUF1810 domain-containing protein [Thiomicrorhabdus xiamenensis]QKI89108.1 DUF1810 domain-containing protein [Thiomicrorhabdus xiamenensis]